MTRAPAALPPASPVRIFWRALGLFLRSLPLLLTIPTMVRAGGRRRWYIRLTRWLENSGATFIKLGQIAAVRPDLLPPDLCVALSRLHDQAPAHPAPATRQHIEAAFGKPPEALFAAFDPIPIASGSIAQVHRARLPDGREVAVKVRHPGVETLMAADLGVIRGVAAGIGRLPSLQWLGLADSAREFTDTVARQLDLRVEAANLHRFRRLFADTPGVRFPEPMDALVHETVLVESFEHGEPIRNLLTGAPRALRAEMARRGLQVLLQMIFRDGFVHADLHPGNIFVSSQSGSAADGTPDVILLDVGMVAELDSAHRQNYLSFFAALAAGDGRLAGALMIRHAPAHACRDPEGFGEEIQRIFAAARDRPIQEVEVAALLAQVMAAVRRHRIRLESAFTSVNVALMVLEGLGRQLDPELDLMREAGPVLLAAGGTVPAA